MYRLLCSLSGLVALLLALPIYAQEFQWVNALEAHGGRNPSVYGGANAITASGEVFVGYGHQGFLTLGSQTFGDTAFQQYVVLAHYNATGQLLGTRLTGQRAFVSELILDKDENLYALGCVGDDLGQGSVQIDTTTLVAPMSNQHFFVAKWNAAGVLQWVRSSVGGQIGHLSGTVDTAGRFTVAGTFSGTVSIGTQQVSANWRVPFVAQFDRAGQVQWLRTTTTQSDRTTFGNIAAAPDGTLYCTGMSWGSFTWAGTTLAGPPLPHHYAFWLRLSPAGDVQAQQWFDVGFNNYDITHRISVDAAGHSYILFHSGGLLQWGNHVLTSRTANMRSIVARLDSDGIPQWVQGGTTRGSIYAYHLFRYAGPDDDNGLVYATGTYADGQSGMQVGPFSLPPTPPQRNNGYLAAFDAETGTPRWLLASPRASDHAGSYFGAANRVGQLSIGGSFQTDTATLGRIRLAYPADSIMQQRGFLGKIFHNYNVVQGEAFTDANSNALRDSTEAGRAGLVVEAQPGPYYFTTDAAGQYAAVAELGTYTLSVPQPPLYHTAVPIGPPTTTFTTYGNQAVGRSFALQPVAGQQDLRVFVTPVGRARPGFSVQYRVTYQNIGTVPLAAGAVTLLPDSLLTYVGSSEPATPIGAALEWAFTSFAPGEVRNLGVDFVLDSTVQLGTQLRSSARVTPLTGDLTPADNSALSRLTVTGALDPNDLSVNYELLTPQQVQSGEWLEYVTRFQNMGTDTAFTVIVRDSLPIQQLDLATLEPVSASHPFVWSLNAAGVFSARFARIRLPHRAANEAGSQGFLRFRVRPRTTLTAGAEVRNRARIFFDFNAPVATNTVSTQILGTPMSLAGEAAGAAFRLWPNPAVGSVRVQLADTPAAPFPLYVLDALGRTVRQIVLTTRTATLDLRGVPAGLYLVRGGAATQRLVVERE